MEVILIQEIRGLKHLVASNLLKQLKSDNISEALKNELRTEFHFRFANVLFQYYRRLCLHNRIEETVAKDIVQETMIRAFEKINRTSFENYNSEEQLQNKVWSWLSKIAYNLFLEFLKSRNKVCELDETHENTVAFDNDSPVILEYDSPERSALMIQEAWDKLDERERLIVYLCIKYNCLDNMKHLPDDAIEFICATFQIDKSYIRQIKLRALKKIRHNP